MLKPSSHKPYLGSGLRITIVQFCSLHLNLLVLRQRKDPSSNHPVLVVFTSVWKPAVLTPLDGPVPAAQDTP